MYSEPSQTSQMERFAMFVGGSILDAWLGSEFTSAFFFSLWVNKQSFGGVQNFYKPSELAQTVSLSLLNLSQTFPILRVETGNSPLQGYGEPVCVSIFWSIINIAPLTVLLSTTCFWFKFFIVCQLCILIWNE